MWSIAIVPLVFFVVRGWRYAPELAWAAVINIAFHSLIGHKEYRFIFLSVAAFVIIAALGSADWIATLRTGPRWRRLRVPAMAAAWLCISGVLAVSGWMPVYWLRGIGAARLASVVRPDPQMCGLALYNVPVFLMPGRERLSGDAPLYALYANDPLASGQLENAAANAAPAFNRVLAYRSAERELPPHFTMRQCEPVSGADVCVFVRNGGCDGPPASSFEINAVLARTGF
jgi:hypothetical protein